MGLILGLGSISIAYAQEWTQTDTIIEIADIILKVADYRQTQNIVSRESEGYYETNPILGKHPTHRQVSLYFGVTALAHLYISYKLPQPYRRYWQLLWIGTSGRCVVHNYRAGLKIKF